MFTQGNCKKYFFGLLIAAFSLVWLAAPAPAATVKVDLDAHMKNVEVAPGVKLRAWTFNGTVPGPVVRATEGDTVEITLKNSDIGMKKKCPKKSKSKNKKKRKKMNKKRKKCLKYNKRHMSMVHSIDFHAAKVAPNLAFRSVLPGESHTFSFEATTPGVYMYHCGTGPMLEHIGMGMYGMIIIDPIAGRPPAEEIFLVQSEFYGNVKNGWLQSSYKAMQTKPPKYVAFNGAALKYAQAPIQVAAGEPIRIYLVDAGPSLYSSFHVVGTIFDQYQPDGNPDDPMYNVSTQVLGPGGAGIFEFTLPEPGKYPFVTHSMLDMDKGAVGILEAQ